KMVVRVKLASAIQLVLVLLTYRTHVLLTAVWYMACLTSSAQTVYTSCYLLMMRVNVTQHCGSWVSRFSASLTPTTHQLSSINNPSAGLMGLEFTVWDSSDSPQTALRLLAVWCVVEQFNPRFERFCLQQFQFDGRSDPREQWHSAPQDDGRDGQPVFVDQPKLRQRRYDAATAEDRHIVCRLLLEKKDLLANVAFRQLHVLPCAPRHRIQRVVA